MFKKILSLTLVLIMVVGLSTNTFATEDANYNIGLNVAEEEKTLVQDEFKSDFIKPTGPVYEYYWAILNKSVDSNKFGAWRDGPTGRGPGDLSINQGTNLNRSFTASITGSYPVGIGAIEINLGVNIGTSKTYGTNYKIYVKSGERKTIKYRPKIKVYKVTQAYYRMNSLTGELTVMDTKEAYVDVFNDWDYDWRYGY